MSYKHASYGLRSKSRSPSSSYLDLSAVPSSELPNALVVVPQMGSEAGGPSSFPRAFQLLEALTPCASPWWGQHDKLILQPARLEQAQSRPGSHVMRGDLVAAARKGESHI